MAMPVRMRMPMRAMLLTVTLALGGAAAVAGPRVVVDRVVLVVNGAPVFESQVVRRAEALAGDLAAAEAELVDEELILAEATRRYATVSEADVDAALATVRDANGLDDAGLAEALRAQHYTLADYREELHRQLLRLRTEQLIVFAERGSVAGDDYEATREKVMTPWLAERRASAYYERPAVAR